MKGGFSNNELSIHGIQFLKPSSRESPHKSTRDPILIKVIGSNYSYDSVVEAVNAVIQTKNPRTPNPVYSEMKSWIDAQSESMKSWINAQWAEGVIVKTVKPKLDNKDPNKHDAMPPLNLVEDTYSRVKYETLYINKNNTAETETETDLNKKALILRLFFKLTRSHYNETELPPIVSILSTQHVRTTSNQGGGRAGRSGRLRTGGTPSFTTDPRRVSMDPRRLVVSFAVSQFGQSPDEDQHYILKISDNPDHIEGYKDEAIIYKMLLGYKNVVKFYASGEYQRNDISSLNISGLNTFVSISSDQWKNTDLNNLHNRGYYILLENTLGYYTYQDYVSTMQLSYCSPNCDGKYLETSFSKIYRTLKQINEERDFFHGDFHNQNVMINKRHDVKLFDFDSSGILKSPSTSSTSSRRSFPSITHISKNILGYNLQVPRVNNYTEYMALFTYNSVTSITSIKPTTDVITVGATPIHKFMFLFDIFRLYLSTCMRFKGPIMISDGLSPEITDINNVCVCWYNLNFKNWDWWHEYFMESSFYNQFYKELYTRRNSLELYTRGNIHNASCITYTQSNNQAQDQNTFMSIFDQSIEVSEEDLQNLSMSVGGKKDNKNKKMYQKYGKYDVVLNDGTHQVRVVWKHKRQFFIKRRNGIYEKISKKNIRT